MLRVGHGNWIWLPVRPPLLIPLRHLKPHLVLAPLTESFPSPPSSGFAMPTARRLTQLNESIDSSTPFMLVRPSAPVPSDVPLTRLGMSRGSRAIFQFYPENPDQLSLLTTAALKSGFTGGLLVDYPNSAKAKKYDCFPHLSCHLLSSSSMLPVASYPSFRSFLLRLGPSSPLHLFTVSSPHQSHPLHPAGISLSSLPAASPTRPCLEPSVRMARRPRRRGAAT